MNRNNDPSLVQENITLAQFDPNAIHSKIENHDVWWLNNRLYGCATLNYHTDYSILMPLVNHIENSGYSVNINENCCTISNVTTFIEKKRKSKELSIFECCYEFVSQYYAVCQACGQHKDAIRFFKESQMKFYCKPCGLISNL